MKDKLFSTLDFIERDRRVSIAKISAVTLFLLLASMNFMDMYLLWIFGATGIFVLLSGRKPRISRWDLPIILFSLSILLYGVIANRHLSLQPLGFLFAYLIGTNILSTLPPKEGKSSRRRDAYLALMLISAFAIGMAIHIALNMHITGEITWERRSLDFWTGEYITATMQASFCILGIATSIAIFFSDAPLWLKPLALALCAILNVYNFRLGGRAVILITVIAAAAAAIFFFVACNKKRLRILTAAVIILGLAAVAAAYFSDVAGIKTAFEASTFYTRFFYKFAADRDKSFIYRFFLSDPRFELKLEFVKNFELSLWGGNHIKDVVDNYAHDIFLDTYDSYGIFSFVFLAGYAVCAIVRAVRVVFDRSIPFTVRSVILTSDISMLIIFMLEPVLQGMPRHFIAFCFIDGLTAWYLRSRRARQSAIEAEKSAPIKIAFFSTNLNHHTLPLCRALIERVGEENFRFVATEPLSEERLRLGYEDMDAAHPFVLREYAGEDERAEARRLCRTCDVMIFGSAPSIYFKRRAALNRPIFYYSERLDKPALYGKFTLRRRLAMLRHYGLALLTDHAYLLCAGAYVPRDFAKCGLFLGRRYKWGYFPVTDECQDPDALIDQKDPKKILWVARFCEVKHPERVIAVAARLRDAGIAFEVDMIGRGPLEEETRAAIEAAGIEDRIHLLGAIPHGEVSEHMARAGIFLFTSDASEGWGAVINEAMAAACAVVSTDTPGSVPYLIKNGENGISVADGDGDALYEALARLLGSSEERRRLGRAAAHTLSDEWNARVAAERFVSLAREVRVDGARPRPQLFDEGICSRAHRM